MTKPIYSEGDSIALANITDIDPSKSEKIYFKVETNKDFVQYEIDEEIVFTITLYADEKQICAPFFKYTLTGDDGKASSGFVRAESGSATLSTSISIAGAVRLVVEPADENENVITDPRITKFEGGAIAGASKIRTTDEEPFDFDDFWKRKLSELDKCAPDIYSIEQVESEKSNFDCYIVKVNCIGDPTMVATNATYTAGVLTIPKNAAPGSLKFLLCFQGYGVGCVGVWYRNDSICYSVSSHSIDQLREPEYYNGENLGLVGYGQSPEQNVNPDTAYMTYMLLRDVQALRFLKRYFGQEGGEATVNGIDTGSWKGLWNCKDIMTNGSSQGGFQAIGVAALDNDVSAVTAGVIWNADIAGNTIPTRIQSMFRLKYVNGVRYLDTAFFAKRVRASRVELSAGNGDVLCPMYSIQAIYNNLNVENATLTFQQGQCHSATNSVRIDSVQSKGRT